MTSLRELQGERRDLHSSIHEQAPDLKGMSVAVPPRERYVQKVLGLQPHPRSGDPDSKQFRASIEDAEVDPGDVEFFRMAQGALTDRVNAEVPVLVFVVQLVEVPEGLRLPQVRRMIRLRRFDELAGLVRYSRERGSAHVVETVGRGDDGERRVAPRLTPVGQYELPDHVVETGPEIVERVSDDEAPLRWAGSRVEPVAPLSNLRIELFLDPVSLLREPQGHLIFENPDVFVGPFELPLRAFEGARHGAAVWPVHRMSRTMAIGKRPRTARSMLTRLPGRLSLRRSAASVWLSDAGLGSA
jgi:hypothetical protein